MVLTLPDLVKRRYRAKSAFKGSWKEVYHNCQWSIYEDLMLEKMTTDEIEEQIVLLDWYMEKKSSVVSLSSSEDQNE